MPTGKANENNTVDLQNESACGTTNAAWNPNQTTEERHTARWAQDKTLYIGTGYHQSTSLAEATVPLEIEGARRPAESYKKTATVNHCKTNLGHAVAVPTTESGAITRTPR